MLALDMSNVFFRARWEGVSQKSFSPIKGEAVHGYATVKTLYY